MGSYVDQVLVSGETVVYRGRLSLWPQFWQIVLGVILIPLLIGIVILVSLWIRYRTTELAITSKRIIAKHGLIKRETIEINLPKVESLQVEQSVWGRVFDYGTVIVHGTGSSTEPIVNVKAPLRFRNAFVEATDAQQGRAAS